MLANFRFNLDLNLFDQIHRANDLTWSATIAVYQDAAATTDPKAYLRWWLAGPDDSPTNPKTTTATKPAPSWPPKAVETSNVHDSRSPCSRPMHRYP